MRRNALLVYPKFPIYYWGMQYALEFVGKKSNMPPLGLLTVAAMFPKDYNLKVVDMNVETLTDDHFRWADIVFTSTMVVQRDSLREVIRRAKSFDLPVVAGGPHPTSYHDEIEDVDHLILGEAEEIMEEFFRDLENGEAKKAYIAGKRPPVTKAPVPRFDLIPLHLYGSMAVQFSRGCPFDCEFCDITKLFGRVPRTKTNEQMLAEMQTLYDLGWRGPVFIVDDNFIGNKRDAMRLLPDLAKWQKEHDYPFGFYTEASVNLANMDPLMDAMVDAGFNMVFLGIETPNPKALAKANKGQNVKKDDEDFLLHAVRKIQQKGMQVTAGFIVGLDGDTEDVFDAQIEFIQKAGISMAMVGLLTALKGTNLYHRLMRENRLLGESSGNNVSLTLNFEPEMDRSVLLEGYMRVLSTLYDPTLRNYFERCWTQLTYLRPKVFNVQRIGKAEVMALAKSIKRQLLSRQGPAYARFLMKVLTTRPRLLPEAVRLAVTGYHFEKITSQQIEVHTFREYLQAELNDFRETVAQFLQARSDQLVDIRTDMAARIERVQAQYRQIHSDVRDNLQDAVESFRQSLEAQLEQLGMAETTA